MHVPKGLKSLWPPHTLTVHARSTLTETTRLAPACARAGARRIKTPQTRSDSSDAGMCNDMQHRHGRERAQPWTVATPCNLLRQLRMPTAAVLGSHGSPTRISEGRLSSDATGARSTTFGCIRASLLRLQANGCMPGLQHSSVQPPRVRALRLRPRVALKHINFPAAWLCHKRQAAHLPDSIRELLYLVANLPPHAPSQPTPQLTVAMRSAGPRGGPLYARRGAECCCIQQSPPVSARTVAKPLLRAG